MRKIYEFIRWFLYITPCVLFVCAANIQISGDDTIPVRTLWEILLSGFLTALVTIFMRPNEQDNARISIIKIAAHYFVLCVVMIICGSLFGWMKFTPAGIIMMLVSVAVVYLLVYISGYYIDKKQADEINRELKGRYSEKE